jgi:hypothetical protein
VSPISPTSKAEADGTIPQFGLGAGAGEIVPDPEAAIPTTGAGSEQPEASPFTTAAPKPKIFPRVSVSQ